MRFIRIAPESFLIAGWQMIWPACHRRFLHALGVTTQRDRCSIAAMMELIFFVFVLLGIVLIDSRLHRFGKDSA
jgi:uncharacterized membrane protein